VQELIAEPRHRPGDHRALGVGQVGLGGEEPIQLAAEDGIGVVAELAEQRPGVSPVTQGGHAGGRLPLDDQPGAIDLRAETLEVLLGLGAEVVDVVERHLLQPADPRVEVARDGEVEDHRQAVAPAPLDARVAVHGHDRLVGGGGAEDDVRLDQGVVESIEGDHAAPPARGDGVGPLGVAVGDEEHTGA
jgi:hypothetical protein